MRMSYLEVSLEDRKALRGRIREWRRTRRLTQTQVAEGSGVDRGTISKLERAEVPPFPRTLRKLEGFMERYERGVELELDALEGMS